MKSVLCHIRLAYPSAYIIHLYIYILHFVYTIYWLTKRSYTISFWRPKQFIKLSPHFQCLTPGPWHHYPWSSALPLDHDTIIRGPVPYPWTMTPLSVVQCLTPGIQYHIMVNIWTGAIASYLLLRPPSPSVSGSSMPLVSGSSKASNPAPTEHTPNTVSGRILLKSLCWRIQKNSHAQVGTLAHISVTCTGAHGNSTHSGRVKLMHPRKG